MSNEDKSAEARRRLEHAMQAETIDEAMRRYGTSLRTSLARAVRANPEFRERYSELGRRSRVGAEVSESLQRARERFKEQAGERRAALVEDAEFLAEHGVSHYEVARRLGASSWESVRNQLKKAGRPDVSERLVSNSDYATGGLFSR